MKKTISSLLFLGMVVTLMSCKVVRNASSTSSPGGGEVVIGDSTVKLGPAPSQSSSEAPEKGTFTFRGFGS